MTYKVKKDFRIATSLTENKLLKEGDELSGEESYFNDLVKFGIVDEPKAEKKADNPVKEDKALKVKVETKEDKTRKENK